MMLLKIAFRNILRNARRSLMTGSAIMVGTLGLLVFAGATGYLILSQETISVQRLGHLTVFRDGYFLFGTGNPAAYGIDDYRSVMDLIGGDPQLRPLTKIITPTQTMFGIAGNFEADASKTFFGTGMIPSDREHMRQWDEHGVTRGVLANSSLSDEDPARGVIGLGVARLLGLCGKLKAPNCPVPPKAAPKAPSGQVASATTEDFADLLRRDIGAASDSSTTRAVPRIDLLSATVGGAPNVVSMNVGGLDPQSIKELDDNYVAMHLSLAQQLVYGRGEHKATGIVLQLHRTEDLPIARARLVSLLKEHDLALDVRSFAELNPFYVQLVNFFTQATMFVGLMMGIIVLFTVVNTITMSVMERTSEIGTVRALGVRRMGIRLQFLAEGCMLGVIGATVGVILALGLAWLVNDAGLTWRPPSTSAPVPFKLVLFQSWFLVFGTWLALVLVATVASILPATRAARLSVVDALRYV